jgi:signal transduction histidine kinase
MAIIACIQLLRVLCSAVIPMRIRRYFLLAIILLLILGIFLSIGIVNSRRVMMELIKEEARSFLSIIATMQENSIFAEGTFEDEIVDRLISICRFIEAEGKGSAVITRMQQSFGLTAVAVINVQTRKLQARAGTALKGFDDLLENTEQLYYDFFTIGKTKHMRFVYTVDGFMYYIELPADEIQRFRQEFGINEIISQLTVNPMVAYLVFQDRKGIIFATPNVQTITRIDDDAVLTDVMQNNREASRLAPFENEEVLELIRPLIVEGQNLGVFRIGINLDSYHQHVRETERQLLALFVILFGAGFILFIFFMKYQASINLSELFAKTLSAIEDAVLTVDKRGEITGINKMFSHISSFDEKVLIRKNYFSLFPDDPFAIKTVLREGTKTVSERGIFGKSVQFATYPLCDHKNRVTGAISVLRDVTKMREFEKEREEAERLAFLGNLVANFAHEIKNPLNGLSIATQRLSTEFPSKDAEYIRIVSTVKKEIESLNKTLNDFLSLARPRLKQQAEFVLSELVYETLDIVREQIKQHRIKLKEKINKDIKITGNKEDLKRALLNVVLNAVEALAHVTDHARELSVELAQRNKDVVIRIADNGPGMDEEEKKRIFTPYFTTKKQGTGLGLFIAQKIIKDHRGTVTVETAPKHGTTFLIVLTS